jgi:cholesterol transport system auxiliary component
VKRADVTRAIFAGSLIAFCLCGGAAGCAGSLFQSKAAPPSIYLLSGPPDLRTAASAATVGADLAVLKPRVRTGLDTDRIALLYPDRRLDYVANARWSGPLDDLVQDLAVQAFRTGMRLHNISADASAFASGYWLEIEVEDFQAEYASAGAPPTIHVRLTARVGRAGDRRILGTSDAVARLPAADNRLTAIVDAYERAVDSALADIVADTSRTLTETPGASDHR